MGRLRWLTTGGRQPRLSIALARHPRSRPGFTLIEMLVVLVVLALLASLTPPLFQAAVPSVRLKAATRDLMATIRLARDLAVSRGQTSELVIDHARGTYVVAGLSREREIPGGVSIRVYSAVGGRGAQANPSIQFYEDGTSSGGVLELSAGKDFFLLEVERLRGRVTVSGPEEHRS